jgi:hypothetical protein
MNASESGHWYKPDGTPAYEVPSADGKRLIKTTLREAKKYGLLGSYSSIKNVKANYGIQNYQLKQSRMAALTSPRLADWIAGTLTEKEFFSILDEEEAAHRKAAAEWGTAYDAAVEQALENKDFDEAYGVAVASTLEQMTAFAPLNSWKSQTTFGNVSLGYGGKIDAIAVDAHVIADFKGQEYKRDTYTAYEDWAMQLCAYLRGLGHDPMQWTCVNFVQDRTDQKRCTAHVWSDAEKAQADYKFNLLRLYWLADNFPEKFEELRRAA